MTRRLSFAGASLIILLLVPGGLARPPSTAAALDELRLATTSSYTLDLARGVVHVAVDAVATNLKPNRVTATTITRYFYRELFFGLQLEAVRIRATAAGAPLGVATRKRATYIETTVRLASNLDYRETTRLRLTYDLPGGAPRSASEIRVGAAFATFYAWAHGDDGVSNVRVVLPATFEDDVQGSPTRRTEGHGRIIHEALEIGDVSEWYVVVVAEREAALSAETLPLDDHPITVRGWPEDDRWRSEVADVLTRGMPLLQGLIGLPWPVADAVDVVEVHTPLLEGYAGVFFSTRNRIEISEELDNLTILHEASHAWFDEQLFNDRWIYEGLADEYASRALRELGVSEGPAPGLTPTTEGHVRLNAWVHPGRIDDEATDARENFGYNASWTVMRRLVDDVGIAGMREVLGAAERDEIAYRGEGTPETVNSRDGWRRLLDLLDEVGGADDADAIFRHWVVVEDEAAALRRRADARERYTELVATAGGWSVPYYVRQRMERWEFDVAEDRIEEAAAVLETRDAVVARAAELELDVAPGLEAVFEGATSDLGDARALVEGQLTALRELDEAADALAAPRDLPATVGLIAGAAPETTLDAARAAFETGDLAGAVVLSDAAMAMLGTAQGVGGVRLAALAGGGVAGIALLGLYGGTRIRRRRPPPDPSTPYATSPGEPPAPIERGVDRS